MEAGQLVHTRELRRLKESNQRYQANLKKGWSQFISELVLINK